MANANKSQNKRSLSERDLRLIYILLSLVIIAGAYFIGFKWFQEKKDAVDLENIELEKEVKNLKRMNDNRQRVESDTAEKKKTIAEIVKEFPSELRTQNVIKTLDDIENIDKSIKIPSESYTMNQMYYVNGSLLGEDGAATAAVSEVNTSSGTVSSGGTGYVAYRSIANIIFDSSYDSLKKIVNFVNKNNNRMTIDNVTVSSVTGKKTLTCTMTISFYSISGTEVEYVVPKVKTDPTGGDNRNIFVSK